MQDKKKGRNEIIAELAQSRTIEEIIENVSKSELSSNPNLKDLAQDLYFDLLQKEEEKIVSLYQSNQLHYYVARMVCNNLLSKNSRYYYTYIKDNLNKIDIDLYNAERDNDKDKD